MEFSQELVRGSIVPIILSLLKERARYGYEMVKLVNARSNRALEWKEGTLYPALHRLEADGFIESYWQDAPGKDEGTDQTSGGGGGRQRKYYALTHKGRRELTRRVSEWQDFTNSVNAILRGC